MPADTSIRTMIAGRALAGAAANVPIWDAFGQPTAELLLRGRFASTWWPRLLLEITAAVILIFGGLDSTGSDVGLAMLPAVLLTASLTSRGAATPPSAALRLRLRLANTRRSRSSADKPGCSRSRGRPNSDLRLR